MTGARIRMLVDWVLAKAAVSTHEGRQVNDHAHLGWLAADSWQPVAREDDSSHLDGSISATLCGGTVVCGASRSRKSNDRRAEGGPGLGIE